MAEKFYYVTGERFTNKERGEFENAGFYVYSLRSWDHGTGSQLEHKVLVNHEGDVITNFKALTDDPDAFEPDFYEFMEIEGAEHSFEPFKKIYEKITGKKIVEPSRKDMWYDYYGSFASDNDYLSPEKGRKFIIIHSRLSSRETKKKFLAEYANRDPKWKGKVNAKDEIEFHKLESDLGYPIIRDYF